MKTEPNPDWQSGKLMRGNGRRLGHNWKKFGREYDRIFQKAPKRRKEPKQ